MTRVTFATVTDMDFRASDNVMVVRGQTPRGKPAEAVFPIRAFRIGCGLRHGVRSVRDPALLQVSGRRGGRGHR